MDPEMFVDGNESMPFLLEPIIELIIASKNTLLLAYFDLDNKFQAYTGKEDLHQ